MLPKIIIPDNAQVAITRVAGLGRALTMVVLLIAGHAMPEIARQITIRSSALPAIRTTPGQIQASITVDLLTA